MNKIKTTIGLALASVTIAATLTLSPKKPQVSEAEATFASCYFQINFTYDEWMDYQLEVKVYHNGSVRTITRGTPTVMIQDGDLLNIYAPGGGCPHNTETVGSVSFVHCGTSDTPYPLAMPEDYTTGTWLAHITCGCPVGSSGSLPFNGGINCIP